MPDRRPKSTGETRPNDEIWSARVSLKKNHEATFSKLCRKNPENRMDRASPRKSRRIVFILLHEHLLPVVRLDPSCWAFVSFCFALGMPLAQGGSVPDPPSLVNHF